jgi:high affinity Mn2+ porin
MMAALGRSRLEVMEVTVPGLDNGDNQSILNMNIIFIIRGAIVRNVLIRRVLWFAVIVLIVLPGEVTTLHAQSVDPAALPQQTTLILEGVANEGAASADPSSANEPKPPSHPGLPPAPSVETPAEGQRQTWNWHVQSTFVAQGYPSFSARYSGVNSLPTRSQGRETWSVDLYGGFRLWRGAEAHFDALMWQGFGLAGTFGIEDFTSGEAYKVGTATPHATIARAFIRQTVGLGGGQENVLDDPITLAGKQEVSRLTLTIGRFSAKDIFDNNTYANDPRKQFMNWALVANVTWDYAADALGYTTGIAMELHQPKWALRYGFFQVPHIKNNFTAEGQYLIWPGESSGGDGAVFRAWAMAAEYERRYSIHSHPGAVRFLSWVNQIRMGSYQAALAFPGTDIAATRAYRREYGFGLNAEQEIAKNIGVFSRLGWNDGHNEAWLFTDTSYSASLGVSVKGERWHRPDDTFGLAGVMSGTSRANQKYLAAGGTGILDGDGALNYGAEKVLETYYDVKVWKNLHAAADYQFVTNLAFNRARGPVSVFGTRLHWEF